MKRQAILVSSLLAAWAFQAPAQNSSVAAETARQLRELSLDAEECYLVRDVSIYRHDVKVYFNDGYLIFLKPVAGRRVGAVFAGGDSPGDAEVLLLPPRRGERQSLARYARTPNLDEHFQSALFTFTDSSANDLLSEINAGGRERRAPEVGRVLAERWNPSITSLISGFSQRVVADLISPRPFGGGFFFMAVNSDRIGGFDVIHDPLGEDQIFAGRVQFREGRPAYDVWTSFESQPVRLGQEKRFETPYSLENFRIQASLDQELFLKAVTRATLRVAGEAGRAFSFGLSRAERVTEVKLDGVPVEFLAGDTIRGRAPRPDENDVFIVVAPDVYPAGSTHEIEFAHEGAVIVDRGNNVYAVGARSNWYPRAGLEFANYSLEFRYPADLTLVTAGEIVEDREEGLWRVTRRESRGPMRVAGFNLGNYEHTSRETLGLTVDVYGNRGLDPELRPRPTSTVITQPTRPPVRGVRPIDPPGPPRTTTIVQTPNPPDPLARMEAVAADVAASLEYFTGLFGPPSLERLTVSPIPGTFAQGFPGLVYLSTLSYLDPQERPANVRSARDQTFYSDLMAPHEVAHQWWGNVVSPLTYQDEWIMEALAHYSALLWLEKKQGLAAVEAELGQFRMDLETGGSDGGPIESFGPLTWGYRLEAARENQTWRVITYEKGAWIIHMLRRRLGDEKFFGVLKELRQRFEFKPVSTADLQKLTKEFLPAGMTADSVDLFFENWVQATGIPSLRLRYNVSGRAPSLQLTGTIEQQNVTPDFSIEAPLEIQFPNGQRQTVWLRTSDQVQRFSIPLRQAPSRVSFLANAILANTR